MNRRTPIYLYFQMKVQIIQQILANETTVTAAARHLGKSRQIVHRWISQYEKYGEAALIPKKPGPKKGSVWNRSPQAVERLVMRLAEEHTFSGPLPLSRKYYALTGCKLNPSTVYRILRRNHVRYGRYEPLPKRKPKLYVKYEPGEEVQMDTSFPFGRVRKLVCFDAIDDCSRWPEAKLYPSRECKYAVDFLHYLVSRAPFRISVIRTDKGKEFGRAFTLTCQKLGIRHNKNKGYTPEHNGKIERWHRTLKEDLIRSSFGFKASQDELQYLLSLWLHEFRFKRPHTGLGMNGMTPAERLITHYLNPQTGSVNLILQQNKY